MKNREKALAKNTFIIAIGTFLPKFTTLITLPILTTYLTKAEYGTFDYLSTLISLALPIATLKIEAAAFRFLIECRDNREDSATIISNIYFFIVPISFLVVTILFVIYSSLGVITRILLCIYFLLDIVYSATQQIVRGLSKNAFYSISAIIYSIINMGMIVLMVSDFQLGLDGVLVSALVALLISIVILFISTKILSYVSIKSFSKVRLKEMIGYSWPMIPNSLSSWIVNLSDRIIVTAILGVEVNSVYAVANKIPNLFATLQGTFIFAWQENASLSVGDDDTSEYYSRMFDNIYTILVGALACLVGITPILFKVLINVQYKEAYYQMPLLFGGMLFSAMSAFMGGIYVAHMKTKSVGITTMLAAIFKLIINFVLINRLGLFAASLSTFVSYLFLVVYRMIDVQKFQPVKYNYAKIIITMMFLVAFMVVLYINNFMLNITNFFTCFIFAIIVCKKILVGIIKGMRTKIGLK